MFLTIGNTGSKWCKYFLINQDISVDKCMHIVYTIQYNNKNNSKGYYEIYMDDTNRIKCVLDT